MRRTPHFDGMFLLGGILAALALGACTGGDDSGSASLGDPGTTTSTTLAVEPVSSSSVVSPSSTAPARPVATTTPAPVLVDGVPQVRATPSRAAIGTRVQIEGYGFTDQQWKSPGGTLWLSAQRAPCALVAQTTASVTVSADGRLRGSFVVPATGACRQSDVGEMGLVGGRYYIAFQCTACRIGELEVDAPASPPPPIALRCNDIGFAPNSDNLATDIVATGVTCVEAEALVRKVGPPLGPINGAERAEADGWLCVRTGQDLSRLPTATYECTSGNRTITFTR